MHLLVMGGTFNPIHLGHLRSAEEARETLGAQKVLFVPAARPAHKDDEGLAPDYMRLEMTRLAVEGNPFFEVSDMEIKRGGVSYTIDTVRELGKKDPAYRITLIVGSDAFSDMASWREYERLMELASFAVVARPGSGDTEITEALPVESTGKFWYDAGKEAYTNAQGMTIRRLRTTLMDISSSGIREAIREGRSIKYLVPDVVEGFIRKNGLYTFKGSI